MYTYVHVAFEAKFARDIYMYIQITNRYVYRSTFMYTYVHFAFEAKFARDSTLHKLCWLR